MTTINATPSTTTDALTERVNFALQSSPHLSPRSVRVETKHGQVRLAGSVDSFFEKQMAQEVVLRIDGVSRVENLLQVSWL